MKEKNKPFFLNFYEFVFNSKISSKVEPKLFKIDRRDLH